MRLMTPGAKRRHNAKNLKIAYFVVLFVVVNCSSCTVIPCPTSNQHPALSLDSFSACSRVRSRLIRPIKAESLDQLAPTNDHNNNNRRSSTTQQHLQRQQPTNQPTSSTMSAVTIEPAAVQVPAAGGTATLQLQNTNAEVRYVFKVKSTNNEHYRVNPVFGFVEPGAGAQLEVTRMNGPPKSDDRLEILFLPIDAECADPKAPFTAGTAPEFKLDVPMTAE